MSRQRALQCVVFRSFADHRSDLEILEALPARDWKKLLYWLDISGLALYFLVRLQELGLAGLLPPAVAERLEQNLHDNSQRMDSMIAESIAIQSSFQMRDL